MLLQCNLKAHNTACEIMVQKVPILHTVFYIFEDIVLQLFFKFMAEQQKMCIINYQNISFVPEKFILKLNQLSDKGQLSHLKVLE